MFSKTALLVALLGTSAFAQDIPWRYTFGNHAPESGVGTQRCEQKALHARENYKFEIWAPTVAIGAPPFRPQSCSLYPTIDDKEWERREDACGKERDSRQKQKCYDEVDSKKKNDRGKADQCQQKREKECNSLADGGQREACYRQLDADRKAGPWAQPPIQKPQTKCCLRLYGDNNCKTKVFEACTPGSGIAQGDAPSWNVICA